MRTKTNALNLKRFSKASGVKVKSYITAVDSDQCMIASAKDQADKR